MSDKCGKCGGAMKEGFLHDSGQHSSGVAHWAEGTPEYNILRFLRMKGRRKLPIRSFRCTKCGFLESYAEAPRAS
jgi:hypothetical protein